MASPLSFLKTREFYIGIVRYCLGVCMMGYGVFKMWGYQGAYITPGSAWQLPLEALDGSQLVWAFVGYSRWFQFVIGALEFFPACLLLFRRTQLLGAVLLLPMSLSVVLINYGLELWGFTKMISPLLLIANIIVIIAHWQKIQGIFSLLLTAIKRRRYGWVEVAVNVAIILYMSRKFLYPLYYKAPETKPFCGDCFNHHPNEWILIQEAVNDIVINTSNLRCYFTPRGTYAEINDNNNSPEYLMYSIDKERSILNIERRWEGIADRFMLASIPGAGIYRSFTYTFTGDTLMKLQNNDHTWLFRRRVINEGRF